MERRKVVERLEMGKCDSGSQNEEDEAFSSLQFHGNFMILSKILGLLINRMVRRAYTQEESGDY